jgi:hypothetical protein
LQKLPLWNRTPESKKDQNVVIAIQTPLNTLIGISRVPSKAGKKNGEPAKDLYHLEIDAETGRKQLPDEKITIYSVEAPEKYKKK